MSDLGRALADAADRATTPMGAVIAALDILARYTTPPELPGLRTAHLGHDEYHQLAMELRHEGLRNVGLRRRG